MKGDGYRQVSGEENVEAGDVALYSTDGSLGSKAVRHSATITSPTGISGTSVRSKGGIEPLISQTGIGPGPGTAWDPRKEIIKLTVWTTRPKATN